MPPHAALPEHLLPTEEVRDALAEGKPVVALESTIIAHGMPYPYNLDTARDIERAVRDGGAVPATVALIDGRMCVGLTDDQLARIADPNAAVRKCSRRDMAYVLSRRTLGATTVAGTLVVAHQAGIPVFATGGIGGVHRGGTDTLDVSADLPELSRSRVAVVSAGAKSILDLGLTLEYLETLGIPVVGVGTDEFPAFYTRSSGLEVPLRLDMPHEIARLMRAQWTNRIDSGILIANPIPEVAEAAHRPIQAAITQSLHEAQQRGIKGRQLTPFLLDRIQQLTEGASLTANIALVLHNARLGAEIAVAYASK